MIKAVIFDFDGTITKPYLNFRHIKRDIGLPEDEIYLLERIFAMPTAERTRALDILDRYEQEAIANSELNDGALGVLEFLKQQKIKTVLFTRNSRSSINEACRKYGLSFDFIITREDGAVKPEPDGIHWASRELKIPLDQMILVGDYQFDIIAGQKAGIKTVLLTNGDAHNWAVKSDYTIHRLGELADIIA